VQRKQNKHFRLLCGLSLSGSLLLGVGLGLVAGLNHPKAIACHQSDLLCKIRLHGFVAIKTNKHKEFKK
jgi:hypothetical protein